MVYRSPPRQKKDVMLSRGSLRVYMNKEKNISTLHSTPKYRHNAADVERSPFPHKECAKPNDTAQQTMSSPRCSQLVEHFRVKASDRSSV